MGNNNKDHMSVYEILERIKNKSLDPVLIANLTRLECVEVLLVEGYQTSAIASLFKKDDRTIRRDIAVIRKRNAVAQDPALTRALVGELINNARSHYARLKQIARSKDAYPDEAAWSETMAWKVYKEMIGKLYELGFIMANHFETPVKKKEGGPDLSGLTPKEKELVRKMKFLLPMDRDKLLEWITNELDKMGKEAETNPGAVSNPYKEEELSPEERKEIVDWFTNNESKKPTAETKKDKEAPPDVDNKEKGGQIPPQNT